MKNFNTLNPTDIFSFPNNWNKFKFYNLFSVNKEISKNIENEAVLSLTQNGIVVKNVESNKGQIAGSYEKYTKVNPNDIVFNPMDLISGWVDIVTESGVVSPSYLSFRLDENKANPLFILFQFQTLYVNRMLFNFGKGVATHDGFGRWTINEDTILKTNIFLPDLETQNRAIRYLQQKTKNIDTLVKKLKNKIDLLKEYRTALINYYITKGVHENVEMKDSGVEWIGQIPKHWDVTKIKYLCPSGVQYGLNTEADSYKENGIRFIRTTDITPGGRLKDNDGVYLPRDAVPAEYYLKKNDILFSRSGSVGKSIRIDKSDPNMSFAGYLVRISFEDDDLSEFVKWVSESGLFWKWIDIQSTQSTIPNVSAEKYSNFNFPLPSRDEIKSINLILKDKIYRIDRNITNHESKIELLSEYRQSLISSIVTGSTKV